MHDTHVATSRAETSNESAGLITLDEVRKAVQKHWGFDSFRPLQHEAVENILAGRDSVVVLPTGGGKSLCFQAPAAVLPGMAVVVSPLISLMKDQVDALRTNGVKAAFYNSSLSPEARMEVVDAISSGELKLLYLAPEGLLRESTLRLLGNAKISLFAIDEAHCISSWGHDFRPEYRGLRLLKQRFNGVGVHAYTATATERVRHDIASELALDEPALLVGGFDRPNLNYRVQRKTRGLDQIIEVIERHRGDSGIVYCISRKDVEKTAAALNAKGYPSLPYHAGLTDQERVSNQEAFLEERVDIVVATVAFGMGIDKSNVRFVIHAAMPKSLEAYQQESGRAGRDGLEAECCLFFGNGDYGLWKRIMAHSGEENPAALAALHAIDRFCNATRCRHQLLVEHFGQTLDQENCGACDACLDQLEKIPDSEALILAQKILSCVVRLQQRFGGDYTALVLAGSNDKRIIERNHDELSTHGLLKEFSKTAIRTWIEQLIGQDCASKEGEYNLLQLTQKGWNVLRGEYTPTLLKPAPNKTKKSRASGTSKSATASTKDWTGVDRGLFDSLRDLRREIASEKGVPAYIVFGDATLRDLARRRPASKADFLEVHGVGEKKCADYSTRFLKHLSEFESTESP
jgi:ATP-dependent DNA helicase RecQ